jgi:hypothetical protein
MRSALPVLALLLTVAPAAAAQQDDARRSPPAMNSPFALEGPPAPAVFDTIVGLRADQRPKYAALHKSYMTSTKSARDSVQTLRGKMRAAMSGGGGREAARPLMAPMSGLAVALTERYGEFESELQFLLDAGQTAKFSAWKETERARIMAARRQRMGER